MTRSVKIAGLVGPTIIALTLSEAMNFYIWSVNAPSVTYLNGSLLFVAGVAIIQAHSQWQGWPALITLTGWFCILEGIYRMFIPEGPQASQNAVTNAALGVLFAGGIFLTFKAYGRTETRAGTSKVRYGVAACLLLLALFQALLLTIHLHVPRTVQFDSSLPSVEINGYKYHMEVFGSAHSTPLIVVHGGPGLDYEYLKSLKELSNEYQVIFYDQRGTGLSSRTDKKDLTIKQNLDDLHSIVEYFSNGKKAKLIGHSWGATLVVGYLSKHPEMVSQAVIVEPFILYPGGPVREWVEKFKGTSTLGSFWDIATNIIYYPFVRKEDGEEGYEYIGTKMSGKTEPGPPYNCPGQDLPPNTFKRMGYAVYNAILKPIMDNPDSMKYDFTNGITAYHGGLLLLSGECSILGPAYQEKYNIPKLPPQTIHIKATNMGHHMITLNTNLTLQTIRKFFKNQHGPETIK